MKKTTLFLIITIFILSLAPACSKDTEEQGPKTDEQENPELNLLANGFDFAEGPVYHAGCLYFSDIQTNTIYKWSEQDGLTIHISNSGGTNGLFFDNAGNLYACESANKQLVVYKPKGEKQILVSQFDGLALNEPNDLWVAPNGNIYFSDPVYSGTLTQDGEHVYLVSSANNETIRVISDFVRPNGLVGSSDGTVLYVTDHGAGKTYEYNIEADGSLTNKKLFAQVGADGLTIDSKGNVYLASDKIEVYSTEGLSINSIEVPGTLTNLCFGGKTGNTLFITTHNAVYSMEISL